MPVAVGVACVADEVAEEGWTVVSQNDAGMLRAELGSSWIEATLLAADGGLAAAAHQLNMQTSETEVARDAATELLEDCANL